MAKSPQILLIDADAQTLEKLQTMLTRHGFSVLIAADGEAGFRLARAERPALVVMDLLLGGMDGAEVCRRLKTDDATQDIPTLLLSALDLPAPNEPWRPTAQSEQCSLRYDAFLPKPVELNQFIRTVERIVFPERTRDFPSGPNINLAVASEPVRSDLTEILTETDFKVRAFDQIKAAVETYRARPPTAVIIDSALLTPDARATLATVRQRTPSMAVIVLVGAEQVSPPEFSPYVDGFLRLPIQAEDLLTTIGVTLERRSLQLRVRELSQQLLAARQELLETQQTLRAQNEELSLVNEQLRQLDRLKQTLTGMLVHDLKSPMAAVIGALHFLRMDPTNRLSDISQQFLDGALAAGNQMVRLADTLLDEQRLEAGKLKPDTEPIEVGAVIEASIEQIAALLLMHKLEIDRQIEADLPPIMADPVLIQRVLENLLDNAIKYSPPQKSISIGASRKQDFVEIRVVDSGPGVPPEQRDFIFKQFAQLTEQEMQSPRKGFGLGLAFCHLAVTAMGGEIWVESPPHEGAAFHFTVPIHRE